MFAGIFDSIFDSIFILIPVAIIIGRVVLKAAGSKKRNPPPKKPPQPHIPVHFVDDVDDEPVVKKAVKKEKRVISPYVPDLSASQSFADALRAEKEAPVTEKKKAPLPAAQTQNDFFVRLNALSQLKQAVVMAEVLGPPKALQ